MAEPFTYAVRFDPDIEPGRVHAYLKKWPEAVASGADLVDAQREAELALEAAARGRLADGMALPEPDIAPAYGEQLIGLSLSVAAKAIVVEAWRESNLSKSELARRMAIDESEARRLLDPHHRTKVDRLADAAAALGWRMVLGRRAA
jgi:antitoxin HicB